MLYIAQIEGEIIAGLVMAAISLLAHHVVDRKNKDRVLTTFIAIAFLLGVFGMSYHMFTQSRDVVFAILSILSVLIVLFIFFRLMANRE